MPDNIVPNTIRRANGGWLAVAPPGARFKIGTTGSTEQEAVERFQAAWREWTETLGADQRTRSPEDMDQKELAH